MNKILCLLLLPCSMFGQTQIGEDIEGLELDNHSGKSVSLSYDGNILAVGASGNSDIGIDSGQVRVYKNQEGSWVQIGQDINGIGENDYFGYDVSTSEKGNFVAIGAIEGEGSPGYAQVYRNIEGMWTQIGQTLEGVTGGDLFGFSICLSKNGKTLAVGAPNNNQNGSLSGQVKVYEFQDDNWIQLGQNLNGTGASDNSGYSIDLTPDGHIIAIGAPGNNDGGTNSGQVRMFEFQDGNWIQAGPDFNGPQTGVNFGSSVSVSDDGKVIAIGATKHRNNEGSVSVYEVIFGNWGLVGYRIYGEESHSNSGYSISLSSDGYTVAIGAIRSDANGVDSGRARIYENVSGNWIKVLEDIPGEGTGDFCGESVSLSADGTIVAIGALNNDGNGSDSGHARVYELTAPLSIEDFLTEQIKIYPNPTSDTINLSFPSEIEIQKISVFDCLGRLLPIITNNKRILISNLPKGIYFVEIRTNKGRTTQKVIKA